MVVINRNKYVNWMTWGFINHLTLSRGKDAPAKEFHEGLTKGLQLRIKEYQGYVDSGTDPSGCFAKTLGEYKEALASLQKGEEFVLWGVTVPVLT